MDFSSMCTNWLSVLFPPLTCIDYCTQSTKWSRKLQKMVPRTPVLSANFWQKWIPVVNLLQRTSLAKGRPVFCLEKIIFTVMQKRWHMRRQLCFWIVPPEMASEEVRKRHSQPVTVTMVCMKKCCLFIEKCQIWGGAWMKTFFLIAGMF